ncbi:PREDICTED: high choriolytic enzyme 1 [Rhagoletis zephyria]|uniref:high choriolytic enzyme 1 n=1 Tax=Rhagoletis zephyria TaxID=28612 RepID=UPI0008117E2F|nr:PREDICTED: high choriolytic enzyme 1 [Rhagoletis zephyria]
MTLIAKALFLTIALFAHCLLQLNASPLVDILSYQDDDDTEVLEIDLNSIDELMNEHELDKDIIDLSFYGSALFGTPDNEVTAELVANYTPEASTVNPEELGSYLEGDILVPSTNVLTKNGITTQSSRWPNAVVPFEIRGRFGARDMATIEHAIEEYHRRTCIRFVPRSSEQDYISIVSGNSGCWSSVGRVGGKQEVNLQTPGCLSKPGTAMHELMHALGFLHEQNRQERDSYVNIQIQNVQPSAAPNFEKAQSTIAFGVPYDYGSVMHYSANAFSRNGRPTIVAVRPGGNQLMGQRDGFSAFDIEKLNKMYNCDAAAMGGGSYGGYMGAIAPAPMPGPVPAPAPLPMQPAPAPPAGGANLIGSFLGGLISGLGLGEEMDNVSTTTAASNEV